jgi:ubiquinone/menaquinone biosynthesis C-methylase UbiE
VPGLKELGRVVKPGGIIRLLEYTRPHDTLRRAITRPWEPWVAWAYGAGFDRRRNTFRRLGCGWPKADSFQTN